MVSVVCAPSLPRPARPLTFHGSPRLQSFQDLERGLGERAPLAHDTSIEPGALVSRNLLTPHLLPDSESSFLCYRSQTKICSSRRSLGRSRSKCRRCRPTRQPSPSLSTSSAAARTIRRSAIACESTPWSNLLLLSAYLIFRALRHDLTESTREVLKGSTGDVKRLSEWKLSASDVSHLFRRSCTRRLHHMAARLIGAFASPARSGTTGKNSRRWRPTSSAHSRRSSRCRDGVLKGRGCLSNGRRRAWRRRRTEELCKYLFRSLSLGAPSADVTIFLALPWQSR